MQNPPKPLMKKPAMDELTSHPSTSPLLEHENPKLGMWIFLGGEVIFFGSLISIYLMIRLHSPADIAMAKTHLSIPLIALNTFILILSSFFVVRALEAIRDGSPKGLRTNLIFVFILGAMFLGGQAFEWVTLHREGVWIGSTFGTPFLTITGIHGTHVFTGLMWSLFVQWGISRGAYTKNNHLGVEIFGLYWHFVDIVWIILFTLFYLI